MNGLARVGMARMMDWLKGSLRQMLCWSLAIALAWGMAGWGTDSVLAAERITIRYGAAQQTLTLQDLETFVATGEEPEALKQLNLAEADRRDLSNLLGLEISVEQGFLEDVLNSTVGGFILRQLREVIGGDFARDIYSLTEAMLAAAEDDRLTLMEIIENFPENTIVVDGARLAEAYNDIQFVAEDLRNVISFVQSFLGPLVCEPDATATRPVPDLSAFRDSAALMNRR